MSVSRKLQRAEEEPVAPLQIRSMRRAESLASPPAIILQGRLLPRGEALRSLWIGFEGAEMVPAKCFDTPSTGSDPGWHIEAVLPIPARANEERLVALIEDSGGRVSSYLLDPIPGDLATGPATTSHHSALADLRKVLSQNRRLTAARAKKPARAVDTSRTYPDLNELLSSERDCGPRQSICLVTCDLLGPVRNGGIGTFYSALAELLARNGHHVTILYLLDTVEQGSFEAWRRHYRDRGIVLERLPAEGARVRSSWVRRRSYQVYHWLKKRHFDWIHFHEMAGYGFYSVAAKRQGLAFEDTTICVGVHSTNKWHLSHNEQLLHQVEQLESEVMERESVAGADVVFSPSQHLLRWSAAEGWRFPKATGVLAHPLPGQLLRRPKAKPRTAIREVIFFGRLETRKGAALFADALDVLAQKNGLPSFYVTFLGKPAQISGVEAERYLEERASRWPFPVKLLTTYGYEGALEYVSESDSLVVLPSLADSTSYTLYECITLGVPFLAASGSGIEEAIHEDDRGAVLFEPNAAAFASKLEAALSGAPAPARARVGPEEASRAWLAFHARPFGVRAPRFVSEQSVAADAKDAPLVSICISHRNRPAYLEQALESVQAQTYSNLEVIIADDGSDFAGRDAYFESLPGRYPYLALQVLSQPHSYPGAARNFAALAARGEYLVFLDDDNVMKPDAVAVLLRALRRSGADFSTCAIEIFAGEACPSAAQHAERGISAGVVPFLGAAAELGVWWNAFGDTFSLCRRETFLALGGFSEDTGSGNEDWELFGAAAIAGYRIESVPEPLLWYRYSRAGLHRRSSSFLSNMRSLRPYRRALSPSIQTLLQVAKGLEQQISAHHQALHDGSLSDQARERFFESSTVLFTASDWTGFAGLVPLCDVEVEPQSASLRLKAGGDPQLLLPTLDVPTGSDVVAQIELDCPAPSFVQIFFRTTSSPHFTEDNSVRAFTQKGRNEIYLRIPNDGLTGELRLDPGAVCGEYVLSNLELRAVFELDE